MTFSDNIRTLSDADIRLISDAIAERLARKTRPESAPKTLSGARGSTMLFTRINNAFEASAREKAATRQRAETDIRRAIAEADRPVLLRISFTVSVVPPREAPTDAPGPLADCLSPTS